VVVKPLAMLMSPKVEWTWSSDQQKAFDEVKQTHVRAILAYPVNGKPFCLSTDASDYSIRAVLEQEGEDVLRSLRPSKEMSQVAKGRWSGNWPYWITWWLMKMASSTTLTDPKVRQPPRAFCCSG